MTPQQLLVQYIPTLILILLGVWYYARLLRADTPEAKMQVRKSLLGKIWRGVWWVILAGFVVAAILFGLVTGH